MVSNKRSYLILFIIVATELIGFGLNIPILPQISQNYTSSGPLLGLLLASYSIAQFFAAPLLGQLSDKYGRKTILVLSKNMSGYGKTLPKNPKLEKVNF